MNGVLRGPLPFREGFIGNWVEGDTSFLFFSHENRGEVEAFLGSRGLSLRSFYEVDYSQWESGNIPGPFSVGDVEFYPVWFGKDPSPKVIVFNPSVVFGSGFHPTTRGCLEAMWKIKGMVPRFHFVADLGTGTGILSLFAARLFGPAKVLAVDINPLSVRCARGNVKLNGLSSTVEVIEGDVLTLDGLKPGLFLANLPYEVVLGLFEKRVIPEGSFVILSGFMESGARRIVDVAEYMGFKRLFSFNSSSWVVVCLGPSRASVSNHS